MLDWDGLYGICDLLSRDMVGVQRVGMVSIEIAGNRPLPLIHTLLGI